MAKRLYKKEIYKTKEEWLKNRGFGGSSASAILGVNPWMTILDLYKSIVHKKEEKHIDQSNEAMQYGTRCESLMRQLYVLDYESIYKVHKPYQYEMYRRIDKPYLTATPDGILTTIADGKKGIWECKTHDIKNRADDEAWANSIPQNYFIQCLHYLVVMKDCDFVVLNAKLRYFDYYNSDGKKLLYQKIIYHVIWRSEVLDQIEYLEKMETKFWEHNIQKKIMPSFSVKF